MGCGRRERHRRQLEASVDLCSCMAWLQFQTTGAAFEHYITSTAFARTDLYKSGAWTTTITTTTFDRQKSIVDPEDESPKWVAIVVVVIVLLLVFLAFGILFVMKRRRDEEQTTAINPASSAFANPAYEQPDNENVPNHVAVHDDEIAMHATNPFQVPPTFKETEFGEVARNAADLSEC